MTNQQAFTLYQALEFVGSIAADPKWTYWVAYNKRKLKPVVDALTAAQQPPQAAAEFERERTALAQSLIDPAGPDPARNGGRIRLRDPIAYEAGLLALKAKHPDAETALKEQASALDALLAEEVPEAIPLSTISPEHIPAGLTGNAIEALLDYIVEPASPPKPAPSNRPGRPPPGV